jgi:type IV pilus assembly protein PilB
MVGEIRDEETAAIAVNAAMTGHLVLSSLHANDASTTFPRLLEMKVEPFLVSSGVINTKAKELGMKTMVEDGITKVLEGITTLEEVIRATKV